MCTENPSFLPYNTEKPEAVIDLELKFIEQEIFKEKKNIQGSPDRDQYIRNLEIISKLAKTGVTIEKQAILNSKINSRHTAAYAKKSKKSKIKIKGERKKGLPL